MNNDIANKTGSIEVTNVDCVFGRTIRVFVNINGIPFKRITDRFMDHKPIWDDVNGHYGCVGSLDGDKEEELESIFKAFCIETKFDATKSLDYTK